MRLEDADGDGTDLLGRCVLTAERTLPGQEVPQVSTHFTGTVRLGTTPPEEERTDPVGEADGTTLTPEEVYALYFHGPAYQVVGSAFAAGEAAVARLADPLPDNHTPADAPLVGMPRLVELCFQAAGLREAGRDARMALPSRVGSVRVLGAPGEGPVYAVARQVGEGAFDCVVVDEGGRVLVRLDGYQSIPLPSPVPGDVLAPLAQAFAGDVSDPR